MRGGGIDDNHDVFLEFEVIRLLGFLVPELAGFLDMPTRKKVDRWRKSRIDGAGYLATVVAFHEAVPPDSESIDHALRLTSADSMSLLDELVEEFY